jgi:hypothetical protein
MGKTKVEIDGERFLIDGKPTYSGREWRSADGRSHRIEGLLMNSRMVQATFDDENPLTQGLFAYPDSGVWDAERNANEFIAMVPEYRAHGLLAVTLNLQGGCPTGYFRTERLDEILSGGVSAGTPPKLPWEVQTLVKQQLHGPLANAQPWVNTALDEEGRLKAPYMARLARVLDALDAHGMVAILGIYYFGQDERQHDGWAVRRGVEQTVRWVLEHGYQNVLIEVNNETNVRKYEHEVLQPQRVHELIDLAKETTLDGRRLLVGTSYGGGRVPDDKVAAVSDFLLVHGNGVKDPARITEMVKQTRALEAFERRQVPILFNEDDHFDFDQPRNNMVAAVESYASWGYFDGGASSGGGVAAGDYVNGYQLVPVNWGINTPVKQGFFRLLKEMTGGG